MEISDVTAWAGSRKNAVLITIRADGRAQSSDIVYALDGNTFVISVTDGRAKTANIRRDPRIVLHLTEPSSWSYASLDGVAELSPVATDPHDATADALVAQYSAVAGNPPEDVDAFRAAMVQEGRLLVRFTPTSAVGQLR